MSEDGEFWKQYRRDRKRQSANRRMVAAADFHTAQQVASRHGMSLKQCSETHYQLSNGHWVINLYPGNQRVYAQSKDAPRLNLKENWCLIDAVESAASVLRQD